MKIGGGYTCSNGHHVGGSMYPCPQCQREKYPLKVVKGTKTISLKELRKREQLDAEELKLWREVGHFYTDHSTFCDCEKCEKITRLATLFQEQKERE